MGTQRKTSRSSDTSRISLQQAFNTYITVKKADNSSPDTIRSATDSFKRWYDFLDIEGYKLDANETTEEYTQDFSSCLLKEGLSAASVNHYLRHIRAFLYWCMDKYDMPKFKVKLAKEQENIIETYTDKELTALLRRPEKEDSFSDWRSWIIINWILATGNRASTICNLQIKDADMINREIVIRFTKAKNAMILPMSAALRNALTEYIDLWRGGANPEAYLFPNVGDEKLTVNALKLSIRRYNEHRNVDKYSIHMFRHTFAKNWIRNKGNVFKLQKLLDHSTLEMTKKYVRMFSEDLKEDYEEFSPLDVIKKKSNRSHKISRR